eukprot:6319117-Pyramimonas_sp.AAC.1
MLEARGADLAAVKHDRANCQKKLGYYMSRAANLKQQLDDMRDELVATRAMVDFLPGRSLSVYGGYALALRRNIAHASALATVRMVLGNDETEGPTLKGRSQVVTYEYRLAAAKRIRATEFYLECAHDKPDLFD